MKAVSFGRDGSERCRPGLQVEGNEEAWPQPVPGTRGGGVHHHRIFGLLPARLEISLQCPVHGGRRSKREIRIRNCYAEFPFRLVICTQK